MYTIDDLLKVFCREFDESDYLWVKECLDLSSHWIHYVYEIEGHIDEGGLSDTDVKNLVSLWLDELKSELIELRIIYNVRKFFECINRGGSSRWHESIRQDFYSVLRCYLYHDFFDMGFMCNPKKIPYEILSYTDLCKIKKRFFSVLV